MKMPMIAIILVASFLALSSCGRMTIRKTHRFSELPQAPVEEVVDFPG